MLRLIQKPAAKEARHDTVFSDIGAPVCLSFYLVDSRIKREVDKVKRLAKKLVDVDGFPRRLERYIALEVPCVHLARERLDQRDKILVRVPTCK